MKDHRGALYASLLICCLFLSPVTVEAEPSAKLPSDGIENGRRVELLSHDLAIELLPEQHQLVASDRVMLKLTDSPPGELSFRLHPGLQVREIVARRDGQRIPLQVSSTSSVQPGVGPEAAGRTGQVITIRFGSMVASGQVVALEWRYDGTINDPPREPRHLRFVTPSETNGHIGPEGVYLSDETQWYPGLPDAVSTYRVRVTMPEGWDAVTYGKQTTRFSGKGKSVAEWEADRKTEALTLVANRFVKAQREWRAPGGQVIEVATYLFPEDAPLAEEYLRASIRYLETYTRLLGPYPFAKFAVVENFFASGLGMPSFTLLGSGVIKRHYVQSYALGHEIVHCWIGNWVYNRPEAGNWVEGLTTYLANYYYEELTRGPEHARTQRRMMLLGYGVYVPPQEDYPVRRFRHKTDQRDNAIGYQKAAMIFHMLRQEIGEEAFWQGLRALVSRYGGTHATWDDLEQVFTEVAGHPLRWFFEQWVERAGAPSLRVDAQAAPEGEEDAKGEKGFRITVRLAQNAPPFRLRLKLQVRMQGGERSTSVHDVHSLQQTLTLKVPTRPVAVRIDPDFDLFRRLERYQLPPMLNVYLTEPARSVVLPTGGVAEDRAPYEELAARLISSETSRPIVRLTDREAIGARAPALGSTAMLVLGGPGLNQVVGWVIEACGSRIRLEQDRFTVEGQTYQGQDTALLVSCRDPKQAGRILTLFYGQTAAAAAKAARLLFFYGWPSYVVFRDGEAVARGEFSSELDELEVRVHAS